jgi:hypothetical protein
MRFSAPVLWDPSTPQRWVAAVRAQNDAAGGVYVRVSRRAPRFDSEDR